MLRSSTGVSERVRAIQGYYRESSFIFEALLCFRRRSRNEFERRLNTPMSAIDARCLIGFQGKKVKKISMHDFPLPQKSEFCDYLKMYTTLYHSVMRSPTSFEKIFDVTANWCAFLVQV